MKVLSGLISRAIINSDNFKGNITLRKSGANRSCDPPLAIEDWNNYRNVHKIPAQFISSLLLKNLKYGSSNSHLNYFLRLRITGFSLRFVRPDCRPCERSNHNHLRCRGDGRMRSGQRKLGFWCVLPGREQRHTGIAGSLSHC